MIKDELQSWLKLEIANTNPRSTQLESSAPGCEVSPARSRRLTMSLKRISGWADPDDHIIRKEIKKWTKRRLPWCWISSFPHSHQGPSSTRLNQPILGKENLRKDSGRRERFLFLEIGLDETKKIYFCFIEKYVNYLDIKLLSKTCYL